MKLCALALLALGLQTAAAADRFDEIRATIRTEVERKSVAALSVAVAQNGRIIWEEGFGWADREKQIKATEHTVYSLASASKPMTAVGLMMLVQAGKIDLDRPVNDYLGAVKLRAQVGDSKDATVRRIANHTSGLPTHWQFYFADEPYRRPPMDETLRRYGILVTPPGERFEYSNLGFGILDYVIERVSGTRYATYMQQQHERRLQIPLPSAASSSSQSFIHCCRVVCRQDTDQ